MLHVAEIDSCFIIILLVFCSMIIAFDCKVKLLIFLLVDGGGGGSGDDDYIILMFLKVQILRMTMMRVPK